MRAGVWYHLKLIKLPIQKEKEKHDGRLRRDGPWQHAARPTNNPPLVIGAQHMVTIEEVFCIYQISGA